MNRHVVAWFLHHNGLLVMLRSAKSDDEDVDAPPFDSPDTSTQSPATSQRRWRASTVKVSNLFGAKDASNRKKELSLDMLEGMNYLHKVAKDASTGTHADADAQHVALNIFANKISIDRFRVQFFFCTEHKTIHTCRSCINVHLVRLSKRSFIAM